MPSREDWQRRLGPLYGGAVALVHSTPWRWPLALGDGDEARSSGWVVALGAPIGAIAWAVAALIHAAGLPASVAALLGLATLSAASAALIERGVVARIDRRERLAPATRTTVMTLILTFTVLVRAAAFAALPPGRWLPVLLATAIAGRWAAVFLQSLGDPITEDTGTQSLVATPAPAWLTAALSLAVAVVLVLALGKAGIVVLAIAAAITFALGIDAQRRDDGLSAPVVAVAAAVGEMLVLLIATIA